MAIQSINLGWILVKDHEKAVAFFQQLGLKLTSHEPTYGWAEFVGPQGGTALGVGTDNPETAASHGNLKAGSNAVMTFTVDDVVKTKAEFEKLGVKFFGDIIEIPGHVKMATFVDPDNNVFQIVQMM